jgi:hypothetical protein
MASNGKKKTTMAKITRENRVRERQADKQARKDARKQAARDGVVPPWLLEDEATVGSDGSGDAVGGAAAGERR